jgi:hypothetical protein
MRWGIRHNKRKNGFLIVNEDLFEEQGLRVTNFGLVWMNPEHFGFPLQWKSSVKSGSQVRTEFSSERNWRTGVSRL